MTNLTDLYKAERVSITCGKNPVIFIAPHGADDINTDIITETLAEDCNGYAIINRGFKRTDKVNVSKDEANCNNVEHCHEDVVKEEFFDPLIRFKNKILKKWSRVLIVYIHGVGSNVRKTSKIDNLNYILGCGNGIPPSPTCQKWVKNFIIRELAHLDNCVVAEGKAGGNYSGWARNNMNQLFRKHHKDNEVDSLQIEIIYDVRDTKAKATVTGQVMAFCFEKLLKSDHYDIPKDYMIRRV